MCVEDSLVLHWLYTQKSIVYVQTNLPCVHSVLQVVSGSAHVHLYSLAHKSRLKMALNPWLL